MSDKVRPSAPVVKSINTYVDNALTDFDSAPTLVLDRNEAASGVTVTVTNEATGQYKASWTNGAWTAGDRLRLKVSVGVLNSVSQVGVIVWEGEIDELIDSRLAPTTAGRTIDIDANNNAEATVVGWNGVALSTTNPLPNAAPDAAGGLPISDAGGLDLDAKLANTNEITAARMGALTDWIDGGRLDLLLDALLDRLTATRAGYLDNLNGHTPQTGDTYGALPANFSDLSITPTTGKVTVGTNDDKTGYTLSASGVTAVQSGLATTAAISALNDLSTSDIDTRLAAYDAPTKSEMDAAFTEIKGATWSSLTDTLEAIRVSILDAAGIRTAVGLNSANLDTQLGTITADTNELQGDWANGGRLDLLLDSILEDTGTTLPATLATIASYIDTEITAIKAKTDNLPADPATETTLAALDTLMDAIKAVTDKLNTGLESDGLSGYQFTALALENGPSGGGGGDATAANQTSILAAIDALENVSQAQV